MGQTNGRTDGEDVVDTNDIQHTHLGTCAVSNNPLQVSVAEWLARLTAV